MFYHSIDIDDIAKDWTEIIINIQQNKKIENRIK